MECQGCCRFAQFDTIWSPCLLNEEIPELLKNNFPPSLISKDKKIRLVTYPGENKSACSLFNPQNNKCKIYSFRPFECQLYPFLISQKEKKVFLALDLKCPFIKDNLETQGLKEYIQYLIDFLNSPLGLNILRNNSHIIQEYPEVLNLAELKI